MDQEEMEHMDRRKQLHSELLTIGVQAVHFQPPPSVHLVYPCIVYTRKSTDTVSADNRSYKNMAMYQIELIDPDPDTPYIETILEKFNMIKHVNNFKANNLNHNVFNLYY